MATPHIEANSTEDFGKTVLMPGDPLRAEQIAKLYLTDVKKINNVRNMFGYTGYYKGKKVSVMGSGMGMPSIGIYSYELFSVYGVENIIRLGTCGSYSEKADIYDIIIATKAYSESTYAKVAFGYDENIMYPDGFLCDKLKSACKAFNHNVIEDIIHSSDVFYRDNGNVFEDVVEKYGCVGVEMESFALFANAKKLGKRAATILTVSDSLVTHKATSSLERQNSFKKMMEIALETAINL